MEIERDAIIRLAMARGVLETELARRMYNIFNSPPLIGRLRDLCGLTIEQLVGFAFTGTGARAILYTGALQEGGKNLAVWRGRPPNILSLRSVLREKNTWSAADCSDLIRLFGGVIEYKPLQEAEEVGKDEAQFEKAQRVGGDNIWGKPRARSRGGFAPMPEAPHTTEARAAMLRFRRDPRGFAGIKGTGLLRESTVKKIDFVFGLPEGCDISGTTADSIFFMRHVNKFIEGLPEKIPDEMIPVVQLLPVATMVSQAHHTLLECALTLTLNKIISYRVGFYTTLMPLKGTCVPLLPLFEWCENDLRNKHVLCYLDRGTNRLRACLYEEPSAVRKFKDVAGVNFDFMMDFLRMPWPPNKNDIFHPPVRFHLLPQD